LARANHAAKAGARDATSRLVVSSRLIDIAMMTLTVVK